MFITYNKVRMHDTDMAGILYFPRQFRFAHDALEDFVESLGFNFNQLFHEKFFVFVIVHAESDYFSPLRVGDQLEIHLSITHIGTTSFTVSYNIYKKNTKELAGTAKTTHVTLESQSRKKIPIPVDLRPLIEKHLENV